MERGEEDAGEGEGVLEDVVGVEEDHRGEEEVVEDDGSDGALEVAQVGYPADPELDGIYDTLGSVALDAELLS